MIKAGPTECISYSRSGAGNAPPDGLAERNRYVQHLGGLFSTGSAIIGMLSGKQQMCCLGR